MKMRKRLTILGTIFLFKVTFCVAHDPKMTLALIQWRADELNVQLELPWSLNQAVTKSYHESGDLYNLDFYKTQVIRYILENFVVSDAGSTLSPCNLHLGDGRDSHILQVTIKYDISNLKKVTIQNTLLFNLYQNQLNFNRLLFERGESRIITTGTNNDQFILQFAPSNLSMNEFFPGQIPIIWLIFLILSVVR